MSRENRILLITGMVVVAVLMIAICRPSWIHGMWHIGSGSAGADTEWLQDNCKGDDAPYIKIMADVKHNATHHTLTTKDIDQYYRDNLADRSNPKTAFKWAYACFLAGRYTPPVVIPEPNSESALNIADDPNTYSYNRLDYLVTKPDPRNRTALVGIGNRILGNRPDDYQVEEHLVTILVSAHDDISKSEALRHVHNLLSLRPRDSECYKISADAYFSELDSGPPYDVASANESLGLYQKWLNMPGTDVPERAEAVSNVNSLKRYIAQAHSDPALTKVCVMSYYPGNGFISLIVGPAVNYADRGMTPLLPLPHLTALSGDATVMLTWSPVMGAKGYAINELVGGKPANTVLVTAPGVCAYVYDRVKNGERRTYTISTLYGSGSVSKASSTVSTLPSTQPGTWSIVKIPANGTYSGFWRAKWMPEANGEWPTLLSLTHNEERTVTTISSTSPYTGAYSSAMSGYQQPDSNSFWTSPEPGHILDVGSNQEDLISTIYATGASSSSPSFGIIYWLRRLIGLRPLGAPGAAVSWSTSTTKGNGTVNYYSKSFLEGHFASPAAISFNVPVVPVSVGGTSGAADVDVVKGR